MSEQLLTPSEIDILDALPDAVMWVRPVIEGNVVTDFQVQYCNAKADEAISHPCGSIRGMRIIKDGIPATGPIAQTNFRSLLSVYEHEKSGYHSFLAPYSNKTYEMHRSKFSGGVLSITRDRTAQREAERKEREHASLLELIVQNAPVGIVVCEAVRDKSGTLIDFRSKLFNAQINTLTGYTAQERKELSVKEILRRDRREEHFKHYAQTAQTGEPFSLLVQSKKTSKWLHYVGVKFGDGFISIVNDITDKITTERELLRHSHYLDSILNASQNAINTMRAIRDENGQVLDFRYVQINKAFEKVTQLTREQVMNKTVLELFPTTRSTGIFDAYCNTLATGIPARTQIRYRGEHLDAWYDLSIVRLDEETVVGTFSDISEIKEVEIQLEMSRDRLARFINTAHTGLGLFQPMFDERDELIDFTYGITNTSFAKYSGKTPEQLMGLRVGTIFPAYKKNGNFEIYKRVYLTGESTRFETHYTADGLDTWFDTTATKMSEGVLLTVNDISEVKRLHIELERYVEDLKRSNANLEAFAYAASHDMKEPIRKITFFSDFIKNDKDSRLSAESGRMFERLISASTRMNSLIEDLLAYSRISLHSVSTFELTDLNDVLNIVLSDLDMLIEEKEASVQVDNLPVVFGQPRQLQQLFLNLLSNALKYSRPDSRPIIKIMYSPYMEVVTPFVIDQVKQYHFFMVEDNGIGFSQEDAERIFNVFQRLHAVNEFSGTGIGLAIARKVVENHKGYIWAQGRLGEGSRFFMLLPK